MSTEALLRAIDEAARVVAPSWPLSTTIAVNPLAGFEDRPFIEGLAEASRLFGTRGLLSVEAFRALHRAGRVTDDDLRGAVGRLRPDLDATERSAMIADLLDAAPDPEPRRRSGTVVEAHDEAMGTTWTDELKRAMAERCLHGDLPPGRLDDALPSESVAPAVASLVAALVDALERLGVPEPAYRSYFERHLSLLPGWVSHLRWREHEGQPYVLLRYLAAAVTTEADLVAGRAHFHGEDEPLRHDDGASTPAPAALLWQDAYEHGAHDPILASIATEPPTPAEASAIQVVCCIDVRSEPLRRHLEAHPGIATYGYAGFFGLAARAVPETGGASSARCPAILQPTTTMVTRPSHPGRAQLGATADEAWKAAKVHPVAPLALVDAAGWIAGPLAALRTLAPNRIVDRPAEPVGASAPPPDLRDVPIDVRADVVAGILGLGIGAAPGRLVVLCGHTSHAANTPSESGLTCGACGGHGGAANASAVATMANDPDVRAELARRGLPLPPGTWFVGAEHDTALDRVTLLTEVPEDHHRLVEELERALGVACEAVTAERARRLPGAGRGRRSVGRVRRRAFDWAEPVAELGLAGNAAFIVGPRWMTAAADLGGRAFLHSYEPDDDVDGSTLTAIMNGPLVVAQWINAQYHFSTTDPELLGAGSKALHNVVGDAGVLSGPSGDLRRGLALQSVRAGDRLLHEPVRLLAVVRAPLDRVDAVLAGSPGVARLVDHAWIHLVARGPGDPAWMQRHAHGWAERPIPAPTTTTIDVTEDAA